MDQTPLLQAVDGLPGPNVMQDHVRSHSIPGHGVDTDYSPAVSLPFFERATPHGVPYPKTF